MRLAYVRLNEGSEVLVGKEVNLLPDIKFSYNSNGPILTIESRNPLPVGFFPLNIDSVTAIVGPNGSGKSSLFWYIGSLFPISPKYFSFDGIACFMDSNDQIYIYPGLLKIKVDDQRYPTSEETLLPAIVIDNNWFRKPEFQSTSVVFYSNTIAEGFRTHGNRIVDISTSGYLNENSSRVRSRYRSYHKQFGRYFADETKRMVKFIASNQQENLGVRLPEKMFVNISTATFHEFLENGKSSIDGSDDYPREYSLDLVHEVIGRLEEANKWLRKTLDSWEEGFWEYFTRIGIVHIVREYLDAMVEMRGSNIDAHLAIIVQLLDSLNYLDEDIDLESLSKKILALESHVDTTNNYPRRSSSRILALKGCIESLLACSATPESLNIASIDLARGNFINILTFLDACSELNDGTDLIEVQIRAMSSGESALLGILARLSEILELDFDNQQPLENLLFCFDEGDTYFHPEWQRQYLSILIDYISKTFFMAKSIQVIFATHSPFLLSDLPSQCIAYLGDKRMERQTFGANIHTLFSEAMFLKSTIGAYAELKINWLIGRLKEEALPESEFPLLQLYIDLIGEPIIQKELQRMLDEKWKEDPKWIKAEIDRLQKKLSNNGGQE